MDTVRTTVSLPSDLHKELRIQAVREKKSVGRIIEERLRTASLRGSSLKEKKEAVIPSVIIDASVVLKWFSSEGEEDVSLALDIRKAKEVLDIMEESKLASYDCLYLWLAKKKNVPLLTEDSFLLERENTLSLRKFFYLTK